MFVHSRKETANTAKTLLQKAKENQALDIIIPPDSADYEILNQEAATVYDPFLKELLPRAFATHHAGMKRQDRALVEDLFRAGSIKGT